MDAYYAAIRKLEDKFYCIEYHHVVQANNQAADELSKTVSDTIKRGTLSKNRKKLLRPCKITKPKNNRRQTCHI